MIELELGCAGCGKTYGVATKIKQQMGSHSLGKTLYAITFTNKATEEIRGELKKQIGVIPDWVVIETIHTFCLEKIVYPFYAFTEQRIITQCSVNPLSENNPAYKQSTLSRMNSQGVIHAEQVFEFARRALYPSKADNNAVKRNKATALDYFRSGIETLLIDEIQDVDNDIFKLLALWNDADIPIFIVGDVRQALKYPDALNKFISENASILHITNNLISRRVPRNILSIADSFYLPNQACSTINATPGVFTFSFENDIPTTTLLKESQLSYIKAKMGGFQTEKEADPDLWFEAEDNKLIYQNCSIDRKLFLWMITDSLKTIYFTTKDAGQAVRLTQRKYNIGFSKKIYAKMLEYLEKIQQPSPNQVMSIQKVKGLQAERCLFIINNSLLAILLGEKNDENKETNLLYVALTRSSCRLHILILEEATQKRSKDAVRAKLKGMGLLEKDGLSTESPII